MNYRLSSTQLVTLSASSCAERFSDSFITNPSPNLPIRQGSFREMRGSYRVLPELRLVFIINHLIINKYENTFRLTLKSKSIPPSETELQTLLIKAGLIQALSKKTREYITSSSFCTLTDSGKEEVNLGSACTPESFVTTIQYPGHTSDLIIKTTPEFLDFFIKKCKVIMYGSTQEKVQFEEQHGGRFGINYWEILQPYISYTRI